MQYFRPDFLKEPVVTTLFLVAPTESCKVGLSLRLPVVIWCFAGERWRRDHEECHQTWRDKRRDVAGKFHIRGETTDRQSGRHLLTQNVTMTAHDTRTCHLIRHACRWCCSLMDDDSDAFFTHQESLSRKFRRLEIVSCWLTATPSLFDAFKTVFC